MRPAGAALALLLLARPLAAQRVPVVPTAGLVITRSTTFKPGTYRLPTRAGRPLIVVRGRGITVDLTGVTLEGADPAGAPDHFRGTALLLDGGEDVIITGGVIRGYKVAIHARGTHHMTIAGTTLSANWRPRLWSGVEHESLVDWLSFHHNEANEWLRYGAAIYLERVTGALVHDNTARHGMNGLLLVRSTGVRAWNNDFSYLSGVGIGLYRSSRNTIMHNRVGYCVRGYSHGFYARGQDSAALLMFEQSSENVVAYNSMTHGGDGLFLWAGQHTMDTGEGGSNDNLFFRNDFSFAPTNGMEATFSRNRFVANRVEGSTHGLWGGYSWESAVLGNAFVRNRVGIAIEHGQDIRVVGNSFVGDSTAVRLWWNRIEPGDWGYPRHRDTRSRGYRIEGNSFTGNPVGVRADSTTWASIRGNSFDDVGTPFIRDGDSTASLQFHASFDTAAATAELAAIAAEVPHITGARDALTAAAALGGRESIIVDEWGPYDWRSPKLWPAARSDERPLRLRTLGPAGRWRVRAVHGASVRDSSGAMGDELLVTPHGPGEDWRVELAWSGNQRDTTFAYAHFAPALRWAVRVTPWDDATDPRGHGALPRALRDREPVLQDSLPALDWMWYRPTLVGIPAERWVLEAESDVTLPPGRFLLRTISDDAIRVWLDGRRVIDHWQPHESAIDEAAMTGGRHRVRVEYLQVDGWTELRVEFDRR